MPILIKILKLIGSFGMLAIGLAGCGSFQKDIDVPLPNYSPELVVECYLEPGKIPQLTVTESQMYLSDVAPVVPLDVTVNLTLPNGQVVRMPFRPGQDAVTDKYHTHMATTPLVARPGDTFTLDVQDTKGRHVTGTATMPSTVEIDSVSYSYNSATGSERKALFLTKFQDPSTPDDAYRVQLHKGRNLNIAPETDNSIQDRLTNGQQMTVGTSYRFYQGDTVTSTLYHIDAAYYRFRQSLRDARSANGNPFGQPSAIYSTVQGGIGVFTVLNYRRKTVVLR